MIGREALAAYLGTLLGGDVEILTLRPTKPEEAGPGGPLEVECVDQGRVRAFVVSRTPGLGPEAHAACNDFPRHVRSLDVGFVRASGQLVSAVDAAEFFQLVEKAQGTPYWRDLERLLEVAIDEPDIARAEALGRFLAEVHRPRRREPALYQRRIRELVGQGEGLMAILDRYPQPDALLPPETCEELERASVGWRWRLRGRTHRLARIHGNFHPGNIVFRVGTDFAVLGRSRGEWGEPADDVAALAVAYLVYGLRRRDSRPGPEGAEPFRFLFCTFLEAYLRQVHDQEILELLPPFLAVRALAMAHPQRHPHLSHSVRTALIHFARRMMVDQSLDPGDVRDVLGCAS